MDRTCVTQAALRKPAVASSPECTDPQRWRPSRRQPPPRTGCPSCTVTQARRASRDGSSSLLLNPASDAVYVGPSRERTANGRRSSAGQHRVHSCDRRKAWAGPRRSARASRVPHSVSRHCPRRQLESRVREAQGRVILLEPGAWIAAQLRPPGTGCSPANGTPEELRRLLVPACYQNSFTAPVLL